ncbi:MAG TPA: SRPBCC family protein [Aggregatilineaceae bacterium]|nr:SRPBCC family protein [Aggregatilineaceae bacterium]
MTVDETAITNMTNRMEYREKGPTTRINLKRYERAVSLLGGAALALAGGIKRGWLGLGMGLAGGGLLMRAATGHSTLLRLLGKNRAVVDSGARVAVPHQQGVRVEDTILIERSPNELYEFWRDFTNLAQFLPNVKSVEVYEGNRSHWVVDGPAGVPISWDAEIVNDVPNDVIAWRTVDGSVVDHAGSVRFRPTPDGSATMVQVVFEYAPTGGPIGAAVARLFGHAPEQQVPDALQRLKEIMDGNGRVPCNDEPTRPHQDIVETASDDSFPASDPPALY